MLSLNKSNKNIPQRLDVNTTFEGYFFIYVQLALLNI